jgi:hypothetical protein
MVVASTSAGTTCSGLNDAESTLLKCLVSPPQVDPKKGKKQNVTSKLLLWNYILMF